MQRARSQLHKMHPVLLMSEAYSCPKPRVRHRVCPESTCSLSETCHGDRDHNNWYIWTRLSRSSPDRLQAIVSEGISRESTIRKT